MSQRTSGRVHRLRHLNPEVAGSVVGAELQQRLSVCAVFGSSVTGTAASMALASLA